MDLIILFNFNFLNQIESKRNSLEFFYFICLIEFKDFFSNLNTEKISLKVSHNESYMHLKYYFFYYLPNFLPVDCLQVEYKLNC